MDKEKVNRVVELHNELKRLEYVNDNMLKLGGKLRLSYETHSRDYTELHAYPLEMQENVLSLLDKYSKMFTAEIKNRMIEIKKEFDIL